MKTLIDEAADLLNAERVRLYCEPLCVAQRKALYNEATWRGELSKSHASRCGRSAYASTNCAFVIASAASLASNAALICA